MIDDQSIPMAPKVKTMTLEITVHRAATNTDEHLGIVAGYDKNPFKNALLQLKIKFMDIKRLWQRF